MSGINYEIQRKSVGEFNLASYKHTFDYHNCKRLYLEFALKSPDEFKESLHDINQLRDIIHLSMHVLWAKSLEGYDYRYQLSDYGLLHLLAHCINDKNEIDNRYEYIHELFKEYVKLV